MGLLVDQLRIEYPSSDSTLFTAVDDVSFSAPDGHITALLGPSGCGKTSILEAIAGINDYAQGRVDFSRETLQPLQQPIYGYVTQRDSLLKWRTALENVLLPLEVSGLDKRLALERAEDCLRLFGLSKFKNAFPDQLSGGMRSRVAIARAMSSTPPYLLIDESFSSIDELTREQLWADLLPIWKKSGTTVILVTHSIAEAVFLADHLIVFSKGPSRVVESITFGRDIDKDISFLLSSEYHSRCDKIRKVLRT